MKTFNINKVSLLVVFVAFYFSSMAQEWTVPADDSKKVCEQPFTKSTARDGKDLFNAKCKSCHGAVGTNSSLPLNPEPGDPASEKFSKETDGALFYKITNGRGGMPAFGTQLSEEERWKIISYFRTFHKDYVPTGADVVADTEADDAYTGKDIKITVNLDPTNYEVTANLSGQDNGEVVSAKGVRVGFYVKRNFGMLPIGDVITTDANGIAKVKFPNDLPGDSLGNYEMVVKLVDEDIYGKVQYKQTIKWGEAFVYENPLDHRAMWGNRGNAPIWLLLSYFGIVIGVWLTIIWVVLQMMKLKNAK